MSRSSRLALLLSLLAVLVTYLIASQIFELVPHIEDEFAYVWQAKVIAGGRLILPSPPCPKCFLEPFVVDHAGMRFAKYPPGWPALLAFGIRLGIRGLVNPLLAGLAVWLTYRLGKKLLNERTALLAALLTLTSPFFLMNSGSLLSHPFGLALSLIFMLAWLDTFLYHAKAPTGLTIPTAGLSLGLLALTRPLTALGIALPFFVHGLVLLARGSRAARLRVLGMGLIAGLTAGLHFLWQFHLSGDPLLNPYTLWWPYDTIGFGPGKGLQPGGYSPVDALINAAFSLWFGERDLFGWLNLSWLFLPFGLFAIRRNRRALLVSAVYPSLLLAYGLYWIGSWLFGPRYYYEALPVLTLLTAAGISWLANRLKLCGNQKALLLNRARLALVAGVVIFLIVSNLLYYTPARLNGMRGLYSAGSAVQDRFLQQQASHPLPALVIVHPLDDWMEYGALLDLSSPYLDSPLIFTISRGPEIDEHLAQAFPDRTVWHYAPLKADLSP